MLESDGMKPGNPAASMSIEQRLVYEVISCKACPFFWPAHGQTPYGPYTSFDFDENYPKTSGGDFWVRGTTSAPSFPVPEIMDGCRKAPIMTIGINPNLTAFQPSPQGAEWMYPGFTSREGGDEWAKWAYYYRHRTVMQELMSQHELQRFLLPDGRLLAKAPGKITDIRREGIEKKLTLVIQYDGGFPVWETLDWTDGGPAWAVLFYKNQAFKEGDLLAARMQVDSGESIEIFQQTVGYYTQFVPVLDRFNAYLKSKGQTQAALCMGEDVCQQDMVACASPHWNDDCLGGARSTACIVENCVKTKAWATKQLLQTAPAVLVLVGQQTVQMFTDAYGSRIQPTLPADPVDGPFTLLRETFTTPYYLEMEPGGFRTRILVSPHFSYGSNFYPQARFTQADWSAFNSQFPDLIHELKASTDIRLDLPLNDDGFFALEFAKNAEAHLADIQQQWPEAFDELLARWYDALGLMADVLAQEFEAGHLSVEGAHLKRTPGSCAFCVNANWHLPGGCAYESNASVSQEPK